MPGPPVPIPTGQIVLWIPAGQAVATAIGQPGHGTAVATETTAILTQNAGSPILPPTETAIWNTYPISNILTRPGQVIHRVYAVAESNGSNFNTFASIQCNSLGMTGLALTGNFSGQSSLLLGANVSVIPAAQIVASMTQTIGGGYPTDTWNLTWVALAVYLDRPPVPSAFIWQPNDAYKNIGNN